MCLKTDSTVFHRICLVEQAVSVFDIRSFFGSSTKPSTCTSVSTSRQSSSSSREVPLSKKPCVCTCKPELSKIRSKYHTASSSSRKYQNKWEDDFTWLEYDADCEGAFCKVCKMESHWSEWVEHGQQSPSPTGRKLLKNENSCKK